jgi:tetratricopeptide (TPR) repeat protein
MVAVAAAVRVHNALTFPSLRGYDGFGHFTYIWYMSETWRVPLATSGWSFFHPPLYYALMAALWKALAGIDPLVRLRVGAVLMGLLSLAHAAVSYLIVRRYFPGDRLIHLLAPGLMLFIPVHLYSAPFLGNEGLAAVLCSVSLLALLAVLARPSLARSLGLGLALGLSMLAKFSGFALVLGALGAIGLQALVRGSPRTGARTLAVTMAVMLAVCGWYYARNVSLYGTPFKLSRDEFMVRHVESEQPQAARTLLEYVTFDPLIFRRPTWPRGFSPSGDLYPGGAYRWLRESVWTGVYANAWFDGFGGWVVPPVTESEVARRAGQVLLCLGVVPTALTLLGLCAAVGQLWRRGWDDTIVALLLVFAAMTAGFVATTRAIPIPANVKATYFMPVSVAFSFWFALGLSRLRARRPSWVRHVAAACGVLALVATVVFTHGLLFDPAAIRRSRPLDAPSLENLYGVVYFAAGDRDRAAEFFRSSAVAGWHLGYENLAALAFDAGRPLEAVHLLKRAARLQPEQAIGRLEERRRFTASTQAEYLSTLAVFYHRLAWKDEALAAAEEAIRLDASIPEAHYNLGILKMIGALTDGHGSSARSAVLLRHAMSELSRALDLDPAFLHAAAMLGVAEALTGDCATAERTIADALAPHPERQRAYPVETGPGVEHAAGIERRRSIADVPSDLEPTRRLDECRTRTLNIKRG